MLFVEAGGEGGRADAAWEGGVVSVAGVYNGVRRGSTCCAYDQDFHSGSTAPVVWSRWGVLFLLFLFSSQDIF